MALAPGVTSGNAEPALRRACSRSVLLLGSPRNPGGVVRNITCSNSAGLSGFDAAGSRRAGLHVRRAATRDPSWLTGAIAEVAVARLGPAAEGEAFVFEVRTGGGQVVDARQLPVRQARVARSVLALLAGDPGIARVQLGAAAREPDLEVRVTVLIEALTWLLLLARPHPGVARSTIAIGFPIGPRTWGRRVRVRALGYSGQWLLR